MDKREAEVNFDKLRRDLEVMLENYRIWKAMLDINDPMYTSFWDSSMGSFGSLVSSGGNQDYIGNNVVRHVGNVEELKIKVGYIDKLVSSLDREGKMFVEKRYFEKARREEIIAEMYIADSSYKRLRRKVLDTFLVVLGIVPENDPKMTQIWTLQPKKKCYDDSVPK